MNEKEIHPAGDGEDLSDAELDAMLAADPELDAMLAAAEDRLLTAIHRRLDLDAGLAQIIGNPPRREIAPAIPSDAVSTRQPEGLFQAVPEAAETIAEHDELDPGRGAAERMREDAVGLWLTDYLRGKDSLLLAGGNEEASGLALHAQAKAAQEAQADAALQAHATATIKRLLQEHPAVAREIRETLRTRVHVQELMRRTGQAKEIAADTEQYESNLAVKLDPACRRRLGFGLGAALMVALAVLDAIPLNWAAQAFGLNSAGTWLVTIILVVASVGAMLGFEFTRGHPRRRGMLAAVVTMGYLALLGLRTQFLITVSGDSLAVAVLQSALLTAISAGLVLCGSTVLARTRFPKHSRARAAARRAAQAADDARRAEFLATEKLQRHIGSLHQMLLPWALSSAAPEGIDHAKWAAALYQAIADNVTGSAQS